MVKCSHFEQFQRHKLSGLQSEHNDILYNIIYIYRRVPHSCGRMHRLAFRVGWSLALAEAMHHTQAQRPPGTPDGFQLLKVPFP
eukprot:COSAG05_NODE_624_length_8276_cov_4.903265_4_plen_84_part_00